MSLITAHKILIAASILFFGGFSAKQLVLHHRTGVQAYLISGLVFGVCTFGLVGYLVRFVRRHRGGAPPADQPSPRSPA